MKKLTTLSILFISLVFIAPIQVLAATNAGVKPGSLFYFLDTTFENVGLFFTLNPKKKAQKALEHADERLSEIEAIAEEKNPEAVKTALANYESNIALATEKSKEVKDKGQAESLLALITDNTSRNQEVLSAILIKVPEEAREAIAKAIEVSRRGQEEANRQNAELKGEVEQLRQEIAELKQNDSDRQVAETEKLKEEMEVPKKTPAVTPSQQKNYISVADRQAAQQTNQAPVAPTNIAQTSQLPSTTIETWEQLEAKYFSSADLKGWPSLIITNSLGEKRYYRKENNEWVRKNSELDASQPYVQSSNNLNEDNRLNILLKMYDEQREERRRQTEVALQQLEVEHQAREAKEAEKNRQLAPLQAELDLLKAKTKELGCSILDNPNPPTIGSEAQECKKLFAQQSVIMSDMGIIIAKYSPAITTTVSTPQQNFTTQKSVLGQHYQFYYDGYGSGSIYNTSNPADSYKIYCSYGRCDIYGQ